MKVGAGPCTAGFIFSSPDNRTLYLNVASHCVSSLRLGASIGIGEGAINGTLVYCSYGMVTGDEGGCTEPTGFPRPETEDGWNDFALIEIPDSARHLVHPAVIHWGGPTHLVEQPAAGTPVLVYGNTSERDRYPLVPPDALDPGEGYVTPYSALGGPPSKWVTPFVPLRPHVFGDSGGPVMTASGGAFGIIKAPTAAANLASALAYMHEHAGLEVELKIAPLLERGTLPPLPLG